MQKFEVIVGYSYKLRLIAVALMTVTCLILFMFLPSLIWANPTAHAAGKPIQDASTNASPNVLTSGLFSSTESLQRVANSTQQAIYNGSKSFRLSVIGAATTSVRFIGHSAVASVTATGHAIASSVQFIGHLTVKAFAVTGKVTKVGSVVTPSDADSTTLPTIPNVPTATLINHSVSSDEKIATQAAPQPQSDDSPQWPIHGVVTLEFGVPHWPFQPTHTGIDISDGAAWGVTPVHAFEPGTVIEANYNSGFGYHVIVDHGHGLTSLYGHMASLAVHVGQKVDQTTVLGHEGSTGESTGVHVHFEIDVKGVPVNPRNYVSGNPT